MADWEFEHSIYTEAKRKDAWDYWSNMDNHAKMEPGVIRIEVDGPFETGTTARTVTKDHTQELEITEVVEGRRFTVTGYTPDGSGSLSFTWSFEDEGEGTRMTHRIRATGPDVEEHPEEFHQMEQRAPEGMAKLVAELDRLAKEEWNND